VVLVRGARVRSVGGGDGVGLPDVHLSAAGTHGANTTVGVNVASLPALRVGGTSNELQVTRALAVAVTSSVLGTSLVAGVLGDTTVLVHGHEVQGTVQAARQLGNVNIEGELVAEEVEHLVRVLLASLHEVDTAANTLAVGVLGDELQAKSIAAGGDTVGAGVLGTVDATGAGTGLAVGADLVVPFVAGVAVGVTGGGVSPSPVGVEDDTAGDVGTRTTGSALRPGQRRVLLSDLTAGQLGRGTCNQGRNSGDLAVHVEKAQWSQEL